MFLPIVYFCTTTRSGRFGQAIVDTVKFLLPIATRNLPTSVNINLNASVKKISAIGCARRQIDQSIKFPQSFCSVNDNIVCDLSGYALFASLDCIVRDRLSSNASNSSTNGISKRPATLRKASRVGEVSPLNHLDQTLISTPVSVLNALYERFKNLSLFFDSQAYISFLNRLSAVSHAANNYAIVIITQTTKHLLTQVLVVNRSPRKGGVIFHKLYEHYKRMWGRLASPSFTMPSYAEMVERASAMTTNRLINSCTELSVLEFAVLRAIRSIDPYSNYVAISIAEIVRALPKEKGTVYYPLVDKALKTLALQSFIEIEQGLIETERFFWGEEFIRKETSVMLIRLTVLPKGISYCPENTTFDTNGKKVVYGFPNYLIDRLGNVYNKQGRPRKLNKDRHGYWQIALSRNGKQYYRSVHRLVLETFKSPRPEEMETRHLDGNKTNNSLSNLAWGTRAENELDKIRHGTSGRKKGGV